MSTSVYVIGAGGQAKVVIRALLESNCSVAGVFDDQIDLQKTSILGVPVIGLIDDIQQQPAYPVIVGIGDNRTRQAIVQRLDVEWATVIHPSAVVDPTVKLGVGSVVMAGAVIQVDTFIHDHVIVNTAASVDHDCVIGNFSHVAPGAHLAGECRIGDGVLIGVGAAVIPQIEIGEWTVVGAGAAVVNNVPSDQVVAGVPARQMMKYHESDG